MRKTEHHFNKETIIKVSLHLTRISDDYYYHPGSYFLGITLKKAGVYDNTWHKLKDMRKLTGHVLMGATVFRKPYVVAHFPDNHKLIKTFESDMEARNYAHKTWLKGGPFITEYV